MSKRLNQVEPGQKQTNTEIFEQISHNLSINAMIWDRDSHGLFDFEARNYV